MFCHHPSQSVSDCSPALFANNYLHSILHLKITMYMVLYSFPQHPMLSLSRVTGWEGSHEFEEQSGHLEVRSVSSSPRPPVPGSWLPQASLNPAKCHSLVTTYTPPPASVPRLKEPTHSLITFSDTLVSHLHR